VVREQDETSRDRWAVVLDTAATGPALEDAVSTAAAILRHAADERRPVDLCVAGAAAPVVVATRRGLDVALDLLARFTPGATPAPPPSPLRRVFLVGERARAVDAKQTLRAVPVGRAVATSAPPRRSRRPTSSPDAPLRAAQAAWSLLVGAALGFAVSSPLAVAPQVLAAVAVAWFGAPAEARRIGAAGRLGLLAAAVGFGFLPGATGGALVLVRVLAAFVASLQLRRRTSGEDGFVLAALLAETALAAALSSSVLAAVVALALAVIAHRAVGHWHGLRARERASRRRAVVVGADDAVAARRAADGAAFAVLVLAVPLFATLPRTDAPFLSLPNSLATTEPGVPTIMRLGTLGRVADGGERVATLKPENDAARDAEPYLRAVAWDHFDGTEWSTSLEPGRASRPSYEPTTGLLPLPSMASATTSARWSLTVEAAAGARLPLPERAATLTFGDPLPRSVERERGGALTPVRDAPVPRWRLDVVTGTPTPGESRRAPSEEHLAPPPEDLAVRLAPEVARVVAGVEGARARAAALEAWVSTRARYALDVRLDRRDPLGDFLFGVRAGHCEYFAAALAVSLRLAGIPSRVVGGFHASLWNDTGAFWVVRRRDAHAWVEAWDAGDGWFRLDARPAAGRPTEQYDGALGALARFRDALAFAWDREVLGYDADRQRALVTALRGGLLEGVDTVASHPREVTVALGAAALGLATFFLARRRAGGPRGPARVRPAGGGGSPVWFYDELLGLLADRGWARRGSETPRAYAARVGVEVPTAVGDALAGLTGAHEHARFGADPMPDPAQVADWLAAVRALQRRPRREVDTRPIVP
jgi:transglutaminase-like putative cysteine protease